MLYVLQRFKLLYVCDFFPYFPLPSLFSVLIPLHLPSHFFLIFFSLPSFLFFFSYCCFCHCHRIPFTSSCYFTSCLNVSPCYFALCLVLSCPCTSFCALLCCFVIAFHFLPWCFALMFCHTLLLCFMP